MLLIRDLIHRFVAVEGIADAEGFSEEDEDFAEEEALAAEHIAEFEGLNDEDEDYAQEEAEQEEEEEEEEGGEEDALTSFSCVVVSGAGWILAN